jgi:hypothetical protein
MRFLITAAPDAGGAKADAPAAVDETLIASYMKFNEDMHNAGVLVASEGLHPGAKGARVGVSGGKRVVLDGPFAETKEVVGGFYVVEVPSLEEAVAWALRCPTGFGTDDVLTIHQMTDVADLPPEVLKLIETAAPTWSAAWLAATAERSRRKLHA